MAHAASGIRVLTSHGGFSAPTRVSWAGGTFTVGGVSEPGDIAGADVNGTGLWLIPGLVDAHTHASWHAFDHAERDAQPATWRATETRRVLARMLRDGFTSVRDAGGLRLDELAAFGLGDPLRAADSTRRRAAHLERLPRVQTSVSLIDRAAADAAGGVVAAAEQALAAGARWIKLVGTASVTSPPGAGLDPIFTAAEQRAAVERAAEVGAGVMLHAWGGQAIDDAIEAGVLSIEHGIFLTPEQAARAAERDVTLVPTLRIYRLVEGMIDAGQLPEAFRPRVAEAVAAHPHAVRYARDAGMRIALGTDYGTPDQHGTNHLELDALVAAGLNAEEALVAATRGGAELLAKVVRDADRPAPSGRIETGEVADCVLLRTDPRTPGALSAPDAIAGVVLGGEFITDTSHSATPSTPSGLIDDSTHRTGPRLPDPPRSERNYL